MRHPSFRSDVADRRDAEFANARTAQEVEQLQTKWAAEDTAMLAAGADDRRTHAQPSKDVTELRRRIDRIERDYYGSRVPEQIADLLAEMISRINQLEKRQLRFMGLHESGRSYKANSLVVKRGGLWIALTDTTATPGAGADWQLAVKSGEASRGQEI